MLPFVELSVRLVLRLCIHNTAAHTYQQKRPVVSVKPMQGTDNLRIGVLLGFARVMDDETNETMYILGEFDSTSMGPLANSGDSTLFQ